MDSTAPLSGPARSAHIAAFGGMGDNGEHNPGALEKPEKGKARAEMLDDLMRGDGEIVLAGVGREWAVQSRFVHSILTSMG